MTNDTLATDAIYHFYSFLLQLFSAKSWGRRATKNRGFHCIASNVWPNPLLSVLKQARSVPTLSW